MLVLQPAWLLPEHSREAEGQHAKQARHNFTGLQVVALIVCRWAATAMDQDDMEALTMPTAVMRKYIDSQELCKL